MITVDTPVVGVVPRLTQAQFTSVLDSVSSPALPEAQQIYPVIVAERVDPAFLLAIFCVESAFGTIGLAVPNKSPGNTRSTLTGHGIVVDTVKGKFVRYPNWLEGFRDLAVRLVDPDYVYGRRKLTTIKGIIEVFAPAFDGNSPQNYADRVAKLMDSWIGAGMTKPNIVWKGSPNFWQGRHNEPIVAIVDHIMQGTMESTNGWFNNRASQVSSTFGVAKDGRIWQWVSLGDAAWANGILEAPDMSIPWLAEAVTNGWNPNNRTVSIEHEGNTGDPMPEPQYQATLSLHRWLISQYPAILPDRQHVIGHYQIMRYQKANCPGKGFPWQRLMSDLGIPQEVTTVSQDTNVITLNGHALGHGFLDFYTKNGGLKMFGLPTSDEYLNPDTGNTEQKFERYWMEFDPREKNPDWQVRGKIITGYIG